ncbi:MAG: histidine phosphatase family protein [Parvularculaceae bacterium]|nr:histidine phosphatase family protein [Parvularculaceae bacterium]
MPELLLLRHAKSDWADPKLADHDRPLAPRGRRDAPRMAAYMAREGLLPDIVLCSTSLRTRQTLDLISSRVALPDDVRFEKGLYLAEAEALLDRLRQLPKGAARVLVIGHNPGLHELALSLCGSGDPTMLERLTDKFPTCALAVISFKGNEWRRLAPGAAQLDRLVSPKLLVSS